MPINKTVNRFYIHWAILISLLVVQNVYTDEKINIDFSSADAASGSGFSLLKGAEILQKNDTEKSDVLQITGTGSKAQIGAAWTIKAKENTYYQLDFMYRTSSEYTALYSMVYIGFWQNGTFLSNIIIGLQKSDNWQKKSGIILTPPKTLEIRILFRLEEVSETSFMLFSTLRLTQMAEEPWNRTITIDAEDWQNNPHPNLQMGTGAEICTETAGFGKAAAGKSFFKITGNNTVQQYVLMINNLWVKEDNTYRCSFRYRSTPRLNPRGILVTIFAMKSDGKTIDKEIERWWAIEAPITEWVPVKKDVAIPKGVTHLGIWFRLINVPDNNMIFIDEIIFQKKPDGAALDGGAMKTIPGRNNFSDVMSGKSTCVILTPDDSVYGKIGEDLSSSLQAVIKTKPAVHTTLQNADPEKTAVIALGQLNNNRLIERLYWNRYVFADSLYPGDGGFVIQHIKKPLPWKDSGSVIVLGGSSPKDIAHACTEFIRTLETCIKEMQDKQNLDLLLPIVQLPTKRNTNVIIGYGAPVYSVVSIPEKPLTKNDISELLKIKPSSTLVDFHDYALKYLLTSEMPYLSAARQVLDKMTEAYEKKPDREPTWPEECNSFNIFTIWDAVNDSPSFSDADIEQYNGMFMKFLKANSKKVADFATVDTQSIIHNHQSFPLLGQYAGSRYFLKNFSLSPSDNAVMKMFLNKAMISFSNQAASWKPLEEADFYLTLTISHVMTWCLAEGNMLFFKNGNIRTYADYLIGICDNRGRSAGFGDGAHWYNTSIPDNGLPLAYWYTKDPQYLGYLQQIHSNTWQNKYHTDVTPARPDGYAGIHIHRMSPQQYAYTNYFGPVSRIPEVPYTKAFDKITFRENFVPLGQFFLLDGYSRGVHWHHDANALIKLSWRGIDWLIDGDYLMSSTTEHNMISVLRDGRSDVLPECASLDQYADLPSIGFCRTSVPNYNGVNWTRNIFWLKGGSLAIYDRITAQKTGDYKFDCIFKTLDKGNEKITEDNIFQIIRPPEPELEDPGKNALRNITGKTLYMHITGTGDAEQSIIRRDNATAGQVLYLVQRKQVTLQKGEVAYFMNMLTFSEDKAPDKLHVQNIEKNIFLSETGILQVTGTEKYTYTDGFITADQFLLQKEKIAMSYASEYKIGDSLFKASIPISFEIDINRSRVTISADKPGSASFGKENSFNVKPGIQEFQLTGSDILARDVVLLLNTVKRPSDKTTAIADKTKTAERKRSEFGMKELWQTPYSEKKGIYGIITGFVTQNKSQEILVLSDNRLHCINTEGKILWTYTAPQTLRAAAVFDTGEKNGLRIVCGGDDEQLFLLNESGKLLQKQQLTETLITGQGGTRTARINCLTADVLDSSGEVKIVAGLGCAQVSVFSSTLDRLWNIDKIYHGARAAQAVDLNGDGNKEILVSDHYASVHVLSSDGRLIVRTVSALSDTCFDFGSLRNNQTISFVNASIGGVLKVFSYPAVEQFSFQNYGYGFRTVKIFDFLKTGTNQLLAGSDTGYIYVMNAEGSTIRTIDLGQAVLVMDTANCGADGKDTILAAGLRGGYVMALHPEKGIIGSFRMNGDIQHIKITDFNKNGVCQIIAVDSSGMVTARQLHQ